LNSDSSELKKRAIAIEKDKEAPKKEVLELLRAYGPMQAEEQRKCRTESGTYQGAWNVIPTLISGL
jgi:hypothetical protein